MDNTLHEVLKSFYRITSCRIGLYDEFYNETAAYPKQGCAFCRAVRQDPRCDQRCRDCDREAFERAYQKDAPVIYTCHIGLSECVAPLRDRRGAFVGYVMIGQSALGCDMHDIRQKASEYLPRGAAEELTRGIRVIGHDVLTAASYIMSVLAKYLCLTDTISVRRPEGAVRLDRYVRDNIRDRLSVADMAAYMRVSPGSLYLMTKKYFNLAPARYVTSVRLEMAVELIRESGLPLWQIGERVGIADSNYLGRLIRRRYGKSYRQLRRGE